MPTSVGSRGDDEATPSRSTSPPKSRSAAGRPWRCIDDVKLVNRRMAGWYNQECLHEALGYQVPGQYEAALTGTSHRRQPAPHRLGTKPGTFRWPSLKA